MLLHLFEMADVARRGEQEQCPHRYCRLHETQPADMAPKVVVHPEERCRKADASAEPSRLLNKGDCLGIVGSEFVDQVAQRRVHHRT